MQIAAQEIVVILAGERIVLRPSLRCALQLDRRKGSFAKLLHDVAEGSLTAAIEIMDPHTDMPFLENRLFDAGLDNLKRPFAQYIMECAGIDPEDAPAKDSKKQPKSVPFSEYLIGLYRVGTGWLGWTPDVTLDATPAEIIEAQKGRVEMLKAIFGTSEQPKDERPWDEKARSIFAGRTIIQEG